MDTALDDDLVGALSLIRLFSLYFSLLAGNLGRRPVLARLPPQPARAVYLQAISALQK
jgi:hypothetical protein